MTKNIFLFIIFFPCFISSQNEGGNKEIYTRNEQINSTDTIYYRILAISPVWDETFSIDIKFYWSGLYYTLVDTTILIQGNYSGWRQGWDQIRGLGGLIEPPFVGYGLYEFIIKKNFNGEELNFYVDLRDDDWPSTYPCGNDIYIYYSGYIEGVWIQWGGSSCNVTYPDNYTFYQLWTQKGKTNPSSSSFNNFWQNCLVLIPTVNNQPRLVWGPYPSSSITVQAYKIYRKVGSGNFSLIHTNNESQFEYTDTDYYIPTSGGSQLQYYIKALFVTEELSQPTNTVTTNGIITLKERPGSHTFVYENILNPNYPNPFNPTTKISYSIKEEGLVTLKVYDILGKEIATLVNKNKPAGFYEADFNASLLPSGMYIYKLQAGSFVQTRKMLLMK